MSTRAILMGLVLLVNVNVGIGFVQNSFNYNYLTAKSPARSLPTSIHERRASSERGLGMRPWSLKTSRPTSSTRCTHTKLSSLLDPSDAWALRATVTAAAAAGLSLGQTSFGKAVSPPVCAMGITFLLSNIGVLPPSGSVHVTELQGICVRLCAPLLLFGANLRTLRSSAGKLLPAFGIGALGTLLGALAGYALCGEALASGLFVASDAPKLAAALCAKNIGGGVNFVAVSAALNLSPAAAAAGLTADNAMALLYFPLCNYLGKNVEATGTNTNEVVKQTHASILKDVQVFGTPSTASSVGASAVPPPGPPPVVEQKEAANDEGILLKALAAAAVLVALGEGLCPKWSIVATSGFTVAAATLLPKVFGRLDQAGNLMGTVLLYLFFATAGASGTGVATTLVGAGVPLLGFLSIVYAVHFGVVLSLGPLFGLDRASLLVASNCNIGGPATAASLCVGRQWPHLVAPALLVGNFGYAVANGGALALHALWTNALWTR